MEVSLSKLKTGSDRGVVVLTPIRRSDIYEEFLDDVQIVYDCGRAVRSFRETLLDRATT